MAAPGPAGSASHEAHYQPARPLDRITLFEFMTTADSLGDDPSGDALDRIDPAVREFGSVFEQVGREGFFGKSVLEILNDEPAAN
jgi:membrane protein